MCQKDNEWGIFNRERYMFLVHITIDYIEGKSITSAKTLEVIPKLNSEFQKIKKILKDPNKKDVKWKVGHGGTLDPFATGVLVVGIGNGCKDLQTYCSRFYNMSI